MKTKKPAFRIEDIEITPEAARLFESAVDRATAPGVNHRIAAAKAARVPAKRRKGKRARDS